MSRLYIFNTFDTVYYARNSSVVPLVTALRLGVFRVLFGSDVLAAAIYLKSPISLSMALIMASVEGISGRWSPDDGTVTEGYIFHASRIG